MKRGIIGRCSPLTVLSAVPFSSKTPPDITHGANSLNYENNEENFDREREFQSESFQLHIFHEEKTFITVHYALFNFSQIVFPVFISHFFPQLYPSFMFSIMSCASGKRRRF